MISSSDNRDLLASDDRRRQDALRGAAARRHRARDGHRPGHARGGAARARAHTEGDVGDALSGPDLTEEVHEVVVTEERPVEKETVPVERVRLDRDVVADTETVDETVRKEETELDGDTGTTRGTTGL